MAGFVRQRNWVRESLPLVGDYSVVRLSYGCRSPSVSKVRGGSDKEAHDHLGEATNHAAVSFTLDSSVLNRMSEEVFQSYLLTTVVEGEEWFPSLEGNIYQEDRRDIREKYEKELENLTKHSRCWNEIAAVFLQTGGPDAEWRFRKGVLSRMEGSYTHQLFQDPESRPFLEETVQMALADSNKLEEIFGWMSDISTVAMNEKIGKMNIVNIFLYVSRHLGGEAFDIFSSLMRVKFAQMFEGKSGFVLNRDVNRLQRRSFVLNYHYAEGDAPLVLSFIDGSKHDDTVTLSVLHFLSMLVYVGSHVLPDDQKDFAAIRSQFLKVAMSIPVGTKESKVTLDQLGIY